MVPYTTRRDKEMLKLMVMQNAERSLISSQGWALATLGNAVRFSTMRL
jgi:hypothetical protein